MSPSLVGPFVSSDAARERTVETLETEQDLLTSVTARPGDAHAASPDLCLHEKVIYSRTPQGFTHIPRLFRRSWLSRQTDEHRH